ncbi:BgTH12-06101 [Blumeria graminis f. sp. triticale]|uniref:GTP cyclohydrolase II n=3 Tax=Blumeria graminis TaxID=34373 RepID=A0A9X9MKN3_BLUGR|nr:GTP cyclohydrolase II [Blumeria graminis f. sp. tritici 96224]CAD6504370.1 BgTH12-06101 [Blumeria graminis f. sp. triticale]VDB91186.1 Bgt-903 [Blumeria graminis f. sp. tritici]
MSNTASFCAVRESEELSQQTTFYSHQSTPVPDINPQRDLNTSRIIEKHATVTLPNQPRILPPNISRLEQEWNNLLPSNFGNTQGSSILDHQTASETEETVSIKESSGVKEPRLISKLPEVNCVVRARIPTTIGGSGTEMFLHLYQNSEDSKEHLAIVFGSTLRSRSLDRVRHDETEMDRLIRGAYVGRLYPGRTSSDLPNPEMATHDQLKEAPLVRIHSECYTGETVWSARCDCGEQLDEAARLMSTPTTKNPEPCGVIIYMRQEGRGIGLGEKLKAYNLQDLGSDTVEANLLLRHPADARSYGLATAMLLDLGISSVRLLTNNPEKVRAIEGPNKEISVKERLPMVPLAWKEGESGGIRSEEVGGYMKTKIEKMGHMLSMEGIP